MKLKKVKDSECSMRNISIEQAYTTNERMIKNQILGREDFLVTYNDFHAKDLLVTYFLDGICYIRPTFFQTKIIPLEIFNELVEMANKTNKTEATEDSIEEDAPMTSKRVIESNMGYDEFYDKFYNKFIFEEVK